MAGGPDVRVNLAEYVFQSLNPIFSQSTITAIR